MAGLGGLGLPVLNSINLDFIVINIKSLSGSASGFVKKRTSFRILKINSVDQVELGQFNKDKYHGVDSLA